MVMKKGDIYGFTVTDKNGNSFTRWFNGSEVLITDNKEGKLPFELNHLLITQRYTEFNPARSYVESITKRSEDLHFTILTEQDWKAIQHPVKRLFKSLVKRLYNGIS